MTHQVWAAAVKILLLEKWGRDVLQPLFLKLCRRSLGHNWLKWQCW